MGKAALILIDLINEIVDEKGKFAGAGYPKMVQEHRIILKTNAAIAKARARGLDVIFVRIGFSAGYHDCPDTSPLLSMAKQYGALQLDTWGTELHHSLQREDGDLIVRKPRVSAFYGTPLEPILRARGVTTLLLGGVATDLAIQTTARDAHDRDYVVVVLEDLCTAATDNDHASTLATLGTIARIDSSERAPELTEG